MIVPPYLLKRLADSDDPAIRDRALANLEAATRIRAVRAAQPRVIGGTFAAAAGPARKRRRVFSCDNTTDLHADLIMREGDAPAADIAVREAYDFSGLTWDFFNQFFGRNSIDDRGMTVTSSVHYSDDGSGFDNAFWNGQQMVYGDGDVLFNRMTMCADVVGHELTHGVTAASASLVYAGQSGALNEHFSDVFGVVIRQWSQNQNDPKKANWLVGDGLLKGGGALRSMSAPGTANPDDPQPDHMDKYLVMANTEDDDWGGVHYNSGIPNRAFHLAAVAIGEPAWQTAAKIWYLTLTRRLRPDSDFENCAYETVSVARDYVGDAVAAKVAAAWLAVGVARPGIGPLASLKVRPPKVAVAAV
jgi:Zn-dependent metalloprotease